jgi:polyhydroxybutyrate depolymerase
VFCTFLIRATCRSVLPAILSFGLLTALARGAEPVPRNWMVDGVRREALVHVPVATGEPAPLVFVFHGHGGTARNAARTFSIHTHWPEAVVVYPQGLNTPGRLTDPEGRKPGWQHGPGEQGDRDLKFFDAMLAQLRRERAIDDTRVYSTGHSNGGGFTYLLWAKRGDVLAAVAPSAAAARAARGELAPKPVLHLAGRRDELVKFAWQEETIRALRRLNGTREGAPWAPSATIYASERGTPVVTFIHEGAHAFPREAPPLIVRFFREHHLPKSPRE